MLRLLQIKQKNDYPDDTPQRHISVCKYDQKYTEHVVINRVSIVLPGTYGTLKVKESRVFHVFELNNDLRTERNFYLIFLFFSKIEEPSVRRLLSVITNNLNLF